MSESKALTKEENWARLMTLAQAGDAKAYESLLTFIGAYVKALTSRKLSDNAQVEDLTQEILLAVHNARHTYDSDRPFLPWLHAIIRFRLTDQLRKVYRAKRFEELDLNSDYHETFSEPPTNDQVDASLLEALARLPDKQRTAVRLLKFDGLSVREAAAQMGMSEAALKVSAHRAYKAMRVWFKGREGSDAN